LYYFKWDTGTSKFMKNGMGTGKDMSYWANSTKNGAGLGAGVFFFDTVNASNPQALTGAARTTALTPAEKWSGSDMAGGMLMSGFVYMNAQEWGTTGSGNAETTVDVNFPGEPFRDIGYPVWCTAVGKPLASCTAADVWADCAGAPCRYGAGDGVFSYEDLNGNGRFDVVVMASGAYSSHDPGAVAGTATYVPKTWKSNTAAQTAYGANCVASAPTWDGTTALGGNECSEPHEPYLNLVYPAKALGNGGKINSMTVNWEAPNAQTMQPKLKVGGTAVTCPDTNNADNCTSNRYDLDGAMSDLDVMLYGVLYNEGAYNAAGNADYYGSVLIQDDIIKGNGTANVWFDEKLIKGSWAPPNMPRVMIFSEAMDESN
jgi:hypothetical protein